MGRKARLCRWLGMWACCGIAAFAAVPAVSAHQTASSKGVSVTMHVAPNDEPPAGHPAKIVVTRVRPGTGRFSWASCNCRLSIKDASGRVVLNRRAAKRMTFTFPRSGAYELRFSGRVKRGGKNVHFRVTFAIRAD